MVLVFLSCTNNKSKDAECKNEKSKRIEYFYTNFYTDHNSEKLFEPKFYSNSYFRVYDQGNLHVDSIIFEKIYNRLLSLKINDRYKGDYYGVFCQFVLINQDSIEKLIVLNDDNFFSSDGVNFVKNDTLAYQLRKILNIYNDYPVDRRNEAFKESKIFNLDSITYDSKKVNNESSSYTDFIGQIVPRL